MTARDDDRPARYLLDEMAPEDREAFEEEYFAHDELYEELLAAEDDLVDAYSEGTLSPARRRAFEQRYLATAGGREEVELTRALKRLTSSKPPGAPLPADAPPRRPQRSWPWLAAAAALAGATLGAGWLNQAGVIRRARAERDALRAAVTEQQRRLAEQDARMAAVTGELERLRARAQAADEILGAGTEALNAASLALTSGLRRDSGPLARLTLPPGVSLVRLQLQLPGQPAAAYRASLQTPEGREIWRRDGLGARDVDGRATVVFPLPAAALSPGHYVVTLAGPGALRRNETDAEYVFEVRASR